LVGDASLCHHAAEGALPDDRPAFLVGDVQSGLSAHPESEEAAHLLSPIHEPQLRVGAAAHNHPRVFIFVDEREIGKEPPVYFGKPESRHRCALVGKHEVKVAIASCSHLDVPVFPGGRE
jgi:hypothetical protein